MNRFLFSCHKRCVKYVAMALLFYPLSAFAVQGQIVVKGQSLTISQAIRLIEKSSKYTFFYNANDLRNAKSKSINCKGSINDVLNEVFKGSNISYAIKGDEVILKVEKAESTQQKKAKIIGVVTDSKTGDPIIGATVQLLGTTTGVITDVDGKFELSASPKNEIQISYIGYVTKKVKIGNQKVMSITLSEDAQQLDEVVVTAFGTGQKKETITGSIQSVRPSDLLVPSANLSSSFAGRLSGVIAFQRSGEPGKNSANFYIRGIATMSGATSPLIVLDGVEVSQADLNSLDPEVIESFSVLKDATASAMYGTRGANGVLIIKTKSGSDLEKPIIGVRVEGYVNTPIQKPEVVDGPTYMKMFNEAVTNQKTGAILYSDDRINGTINKLNPYIYPNVDWYNEVFKDATFNQKANFNVRGGTSKITYFMNLNMNHETGMLKDRSSDFFSYKNNINYMKYAFQNNVDFHLSKSSTISLHLNAQLNDMHGPLTSNNGNGVGDIFGAIMGTNPVDFPVMFPQGSDDWYHWGSLLAGNYTPANPVALASMGYKDTFESTVVANINWDQKLDFITKGLSFKALISFKNWSYNQKFRLQGYNKYQLSDYKQNEDGSYEFVDTPVGEPGNHTMESSFGTNGDRRIYIQAYLDYARTFGSHNLSGMLLYNQDDYNTNVNSSLIGSLPRRKMGVAARLTYDYAHRYMLEANAGYNGSESFAEGHRWGLFPSISLGWNISEEKFWEPLKSVVSNFKLRGSYGLVGNDAIGGDRFAYLAIVNLANSPAYTTGYGNNKITLSGPTYNRFQNNDLTWEIGHKLNVGADLQLFHSLNLTIDGFREIRDNIFQQKNSIPNYFGTAATKIYGNFAKVKNSGIDIALDYGKSVNRDLSIQFKGTFTYAHNEVLEYDEAEGLRPALSQVGRSLSTYLGYVANGLYIDEADIKNNPQSTLGNIAIAPGDVKFVDQPDADGKYDGKITSDDRVQLGYPVVPEIIYGFGPSVKWKDWDFSFFFQGQTHVSLMMSGFEPFGTQSKRNVLKWIKDDYWSKDNQNPDARYPRLTQYNNQNNMQASSYWLRDASFLKLRNAEIGYNFKFARIYVNGSNLLTFSPFKLWDPEMGGGAGMSYPTQRTFNVGIQLTFK